MALLYARPGYSRDWIHGWWIYTCLDSDLPEAQIALVVFTPGCLSAGQQLDHELDVVPDLYQLAYQADPAETWRHCCLPQSYSVFLRADPG